MDTSVQTFLKETNRPLYGRTPGALIGGFGPRTNINQLNPYERIEYERWQNKKTSFQFNNNNLSSSSLSVDTSFSTFLRERGYSTTVVVRRGFLGIGRKKEPKTYNNASSSEKAEYNRWKSQKISQAQYLQSLVQTSSSGGSTKVVGSQTDIPDLNVDIERILNQTSEREKANKKLLEQIERISAVDLSEDLTNYIGDNDIESKYPGLIRSIESAVSNYGNQFRELEEYAQVVVTNTISNTSEILNHVQWMITPPNSVNDVELIPAESLGSWVLQTTEDVGLGAGTGNADLTVKPVIEEPQEVKEQQVKPVQLDIPIFGIQKDGEKISKGKTIPFDERNIARPFTGGTNRKINQFL